MNEKHEPLIHSHITDMLPEDNPLAYETVYCEVCEHMVHASNNECMTTWVESGLGNYCLDCFTHQKNSCVLDKDYGLS